MAKPVVPAVHESREQDLRDSEDTHDDEDEVWTQSLSLDAPPARKGMRQRWVRFYVGGREDHNNISRKFKDGWKPREAATVPKNFSAPIIEAGRFAGFIGVHGAVLCEIPEKRAQAREKYYSNLTRARTEALESQLQRVGQVAGGKGFGPIVSEKKSTLVREVKVAQDKE